MKSAKWNHTTMPSRNFAMITENPLTNAPTVSNSSSNHVNGNPNLHGSAHSRAEDESPPHTPLSIAVGECTGKDGHSPLHAGEVNAGSENRAVHVHGQSADGSLDV